MLCKCSGKYIDIYFILKITCLFIFCLVYTIRIFFCSFTYVKENELNNSNINANYLKIFAKFPPSLNVINDMLPLCI